MGSGFAPVPLRFWSNNIWGLNTPERRSHLLRTLWMERVCIAFLQETHFRGDTSPPMRDSRYPHGFYANHLTTKSRHTASKHSTVRVHGKDG
ncbi:Hypothetical predicted protein [Pelobates cultripes]|uniref:Uncharacterized protein n=1 Tax=Pelobates cultripes TaxID=61616 RepID=A0AAD1VVU8_PELCU|nr:Hypothetical predicted protein [Pelobates cultripes]